VRDETLTVPCYGGEMAGPGHLRQVFNGNPASVLWLINGQRLLWPAPDIFRKFARPPLAAPSQRTLSVWLQSRNNPKSKS